ncbi:uncharacterized protein OCT59_024426 [Rhizophagus irregularis]|uniref:uncharacterized protein n=1 Tax=Rhizophagus irregularis TaxID=588596 RepID=UPI0019FFFFA4|nr:hypothetical protein OCT59_024426 [Rhizophagus irregularis]GBC14208.2 hypothetical protein GLOIN_2v1790397 [Rhizophagus irregularis DAOM 181602=DAOM 197198]
MYTRACNIFKLSQPSILDFVKVSLDIAINIQNTNGNLWKIKIRRTADNDHVKEYNQTIHQYRLNIKYVSVFLNDDEP